MQTNRLGQTDLHVSEIGLGCMNLGDNEQNAKSIIDEAVQNGINYLDTADLYGFGENEKMVGKAIKGKRDELIIATKGGNHFEPGQDGWYWDPSKAYLKEAVKNSLLRLGLDDVDLYQLHGGTIDDSIDEVVEAFEELQQEGLIRHVGLSSIRPNVIKAFVNRMTISSVMMQYSLLDRRPEETMLEYLDDHQISVMVRGTLGKGMLTDKGLTQWEAKGQDGFLNYTAEELNHVIDQLQMTAQNYGVTPQSLAINYTLQHSAVSSLILGASRPEQVRKNLEAYQNQPTNASIFTNMQSSLKTQLYDQHRA